MTNVWLREELEEILLMEQLRTTLDLSRDIISDRYLRMALSGCESYNALLSVYGKQHGPSLLCQVEH